VPVHHPQALWDLRQHPAIHAVFAAVRGTDRLWVSMDRAIYKAPAHPDQPDESRIHWDLDPRSLAWPSVQGMLFLTDTLDGRAPFACVPSLFAALDRYLADHPVLDLEAPLDLDGHAVIDVPVRAGDLVVWDSRLPHHGGPNRSGAPRLSVPIAMWPEGPDDERAERIGWWRDRRAPPWWRGWPGQQDPEPGPPAELGPLGRRLVGVDRWP
ncbi:MAG: phytanoyl-CoA dioxygenase family protein, partial [Myxococcota bacterium]